MDDLDVPDLRTADLRRALPVAASPVPAVQRDHLVGATAALLDRDVHGTKLPWVLAADAEDDAAVPGAVQVGDLLCDQRRG